MKHVSLSEICSVNPRLPSSLANQTDRDVDFIPMASVGEDGRILPNGTRKLGEVLRGYTYFENGDVIVAKITPCLENGKAAYVHDLPHQIAFGSTEFYVLRPKPDADPRYLFYMIWNPRFRHEASRSMTGTAGQQRVPTGFVERFKIPLPPLAEQHRIAGILDKADAIRKLRSKAKVTAEGLPTGIFAEMFSEEMSQTNRTATLDSLADIASGVMKGRRFNGATTRVVPYLRVANVQAGFLDLSEMKTIEALLAEVEMLALKQGDVVMTEGGDHDKLGRGALWEHDIPNCIHQNHIFRVRLDRSRLLPIFFAAFLQTRRAKGYFLQCAKKTTNLATINMRQLKALPVPVPPMDEQLQFEARMRAFRPLADRQAASQVGTNDLFDSLVQRAFRGDL